MVVGVGVVGLELGMGGGRCGDDCEDMMLELGDECV